MCPFSPPTIGTRRRAAAIASPSRVCAFSRTSSSSRAACQVARSTTGGLPGSFLLALPGVVVTVSSAVSSRVLAGSLGEPVSSDDSRCRDSSIRKLIEGPFAWIQTIPGGRQNPSRGPERNRAWFTIPAALYHLLPITPLHHHPPSP